MPAGPVHRFGSVDGRIGSPPIVNNTGTVLPPAALPAQSGAKRTLPEGKCLLFRESICEPAHTCS